MTRRITAAAATANPSSYFHSRPRYAYRLMTLALSAAVLWLAHLAPAGAQDTGSDHAAHRHAGHGHHMEPWMYDALREKVELYRNLTNEEIDLSMLMMGRDYFERISGDGVRGPVGVLVLAHGFGETGDRVFREQLVPIGGEQPVAVAFGMSMTWSGHIQQAVDDLHASGAETIVVVPALSAPWNSQMRQWEYMFGIHDDAGYLETARIRSDARLIYSRPLADHPLVAEALRDHALEITTDPSRALLVLVSHGPESEEDNRVTLHMLDRLAADIREQAGFRAIATVSMQNDAPREIQQRNARRLRDLVEQANNDGHEVAIVTNLIATRSIQNEIRGHLQGLDYRFNAKGMTQHPNFTRWVRATVTEELAGSRP